MSIGDRVFYDPEQLNGTVISKRNIAGMNQVKVKWDKKFRISEWLGTEYLKVVKG